MAMELPINYKMRFGKTEWSNLIKSLGLLISVLIIISFIILFIKYAIFSLR